jgi:SAM-dependent methyltransferase
MPHPPAAGPRLTAIDRLRLLLPRGWRGALNRALYEAAYRIPAVAASGFFNGGYLPLSPGLLSVPGLAATAAQANLYQFVMRDHPAGLVWEPAHVLEIGCGAGGGLLYAGVAWPRSRLTGIDASATAIAAARLRLRQRPEITLIEGRGEALPLADAHFDLVISIGTLTNIGAARFMAEAGRVLLPGGVLSISAGTGWAAADYRAMLAATAAAAGLHLLRFTDITAGALAAIEADAPAHAAMIAGLPWFLRHQAREWAALPGSARHGRYRSGARRDVAAVFRRAA